MYDHKNVSSRFLMYFAEIIDSDDFAKTMPNSTKKKTEMNILRYYICKNGRKRLVLFSVLHFFSHSIIMHGIILFHA